MRGAKRKATRIVASDPISLACGIKVIAIAPLTSLLALLAIRWEPSGYDIDGEDHVSVPPVTERVGA